ncbi:hypothetical protein UPYG_G00224040 [Umbra pygmaea]|uniref:Uncharacterized protein n=1 Tax=Umbra pygmaea TaxID=75934 RepID=A0ABD0WD24_UMBPY
MARPRLASKASHLAFRCVRQSRRSAPMNRPSGVHLAVFHRSWQKYFLHSSAAKHPSSSHPVSHGQIVGNNTKSAPFYGNIMKVQTTGASQETAKAALEEDCNGIPASHKMAKNDIAVINENKAFIINMAKKTKMEPAVICGLISREFLTGNTFGLKQGQWKSEEHLENIIGILILYIEKIKEKFPSWTKEKQLKGGIAAYNIREDWDSIMSYEDVDATTTGKDYSNDVVARAQWFYSHGYSDKVGAVALAPFALAAVGFTAGGIAAGSTAVGMMSAAAVANGGVVAAGSLVAILQSAGAAGLSGAATTVVASAGAAIGGAAGGALGWFKKKFS